MESRSEEKGKGRGRGTREGVGGISRGLEFWREFVEDGACCDRVSLGESERREPGKLRASSSPRRAAGSRAAARLASGSRGGGVACAERGGGGGGVWPCAARSAPPWLGLRRVRAGGGGGEAGGCGCECGPGARGPRAPCPPRAFRAAARRPCLPAPRSFVPRGRRRRLAGPVPPVPCALSFPAAPRYSLPPALCFAALGALSDPSRPASFLPLLPSAVLPPEPLCCPPLYSVA